MTRKNDVTDPLPYPAALQAAPRLSDFWELATYQERALRDEVQA